MIRDLMYAPIVLALLILAMPVAAEEGSAKASLNVRQGPGLNNPVIGGLAPGEPVTIEKCANGWCLVTTLSTRGWVAEPYLQRARFSQSWSASSPDLPATIPNDQSNVSISVQLNLGTGKRH